MNTGKNNKDIEEYIKRVDNIDIKEIINLIEKFYNIKINKYQIITQGYEDLNVKVYSNRGIFLAKIFNKVRNDKECSDIVKRFSAAYEIGVNCPKLILNRKQSFFTKESTLRCVLMEFISGQDFERMNRNLKKNEMIDLLKEAKKFERHNVSFEKIYNSWEINNFALEYEKNFKCFTKNEIALFGPIYNRFQDVDFSMYPQSYIHGDINAGNTMKNDDGKIVLVDLCSANYSYRINEILTICSSGLVLNHDYKKAKRNIDFLFELWSKEFKATDMEKKNFYFLYQVQTALNYMQDLIEYKRGNQSTDNIANLKEDYEALILATKLLQKNV